MLVSKDDQILRTPTTAFDFLNPQRDPLELVELLKKTMIEKRALGLTASQIGIPLSVFVAGDFNDPDNIIAVFNPKIVNQSEEQVIIEEGCLSFPGLFIKVKRSENIRVRYADASGNVDTYEYEGMPARVFLHEYDHVNGEVFTDKVSKLQLSRAYKQKEKLDRKRNANQALRAKTQLNVSTNSSNIKIPQPVVQNKIARGASRGG